VTGNRLRRCPGCRQEFWAGPDDGPYCSALCAGQVSVWTLLAVAQRAAAWARYTGTYR
jgi:hypothetical protein